MIKKAWREEVSLEENLNMIRDDIKGWKYNTFHLAIVKKKEILARKYDKCNHPFCNECRNNCEVEWGHM